MLKGDNVTIRSIEKGDFELFLENFEKSTKNITRFYAIIEDKNGNPIGEINSIEVIGSNTTLEIGL